MSFSDKAPHTYARLLPFLSGFFHCHFSRFVSVYDKAQWHRNKTHREDARPKVLSNLRFSQYGWLAVGYLLGATGTTSRPVAPSAQLFGATRDPIKLSKLHRR